MKRFVKLPFLVFAFCWMASTEMRSAQAVNYAAIWEKPAPVAWVAQHGLTAAQYQASFTQFTGQGYRPIWVNGYEVNGVAYYAAVWDKSTGPAWIAKHGLTATQYQDTFTQLSGQGYRPIHISGYSIQGADHYAAIWIKDSSVSWVARHGLNAAAYQAAFTDFLAQGYRLVDICGYPRNGEATYAALWEKSTGTAWVARHGLTAAAYQSAFTDFANQGYRLRKVSGYTVGGVDYYAAIWDKSSVTAWQARHRMTAAAYQAAFTDLANQGYRLVDVTGYPIGDDSTPVPNIPTTGVPVASLQPFDDTMKRFMGARSISAGVLCVSKDGKLLLERGYGWKDSAKQIPLKPSAPFRIASLCKPITEAAVRKLLAAGKLKLTDFAFNLSQPAGGILTITPFGTPDARLKQVTVAQLLAHTGGWDRDISGDPMFNVIAIAQTLGVANPPSQVDIVRYMMGRPLDHNPGSTYAYSNFGYLLLGLIVEKVGGTDYVDYIHENLFSPIGVPVSEIGLGRSLPGLRNPREPWYSDPNNGVNVFSPPQVVPFPDGGFYLEAMEAHGGLIATPRAYDRFLQKYWIDGQPRSGNGQTWTFFGSLPGTLTLGHQRPDGVNVVAFFNQRTDPSGLDYESIEGLLDQAADSITTWPTTDVSTLLPTRPKLVVKNIAPKGLQFPTEIGRTYQLTQSLDLNAWNNRGVYVVGDGALREISVDLGSGADVTRLYYRLNVE